MTEQIAVTLVVTDALDALGVPYVIGGSLASALHGVMRATMDVDVVADMGIVIHFIATEADHPPGEVDDPHRLTHIQYEHVTAGAHGAGLQHQLRGFGNAHEIAGDFRVRDGNRSAPFNLLAEQGYD